MNMDKSKYTRNNFHSSLLKQIIIRVDFSNITDLNKFILTIKSTDWIRECFQSYRTIQANNFNMNLSPKVFEDKVIPLSVIETATIHRFYECKIEPVQSDVTLDITDTFISITIHCNDTYKSINPYIDCISNIVGELFTYDPFTQIQRVAIRKIDGQDFENEDAVYEVFEKDKSANSTLIEGHARLIKKSYTDAYLDTHANIKINLSRSMEVLLENKYRYVLDIDGYIDTSLNILNNCRDKQGIQDILQFRINEHLFCIFKDNVTKGYLDSGIKDHE